MRIGINCLDLNDRMGGLRQYGQRLIRELLDNDGDNNYVVFHSRDNGHEIELIGSGRMRDVARPVSGYGELFCKLEDIDLYFCPFASLWPRPLPVASVVNLSDIQEVFYPQFFTQEALESRKRNYLPSTRRADSVLTVSEFSKRTLVEHHGISPDKIFVAYHCAEESMFISPPGDPLRQFTLPDRFIFYPANYWHHKNHDVLLRALGLLRKEKGVVVPCVLTGHEADNGYPIQQKIVEYGLVDQVRLLGYVTNEEIRALFHRAEALCFPSLFEGFGMPLVDAMAAGLPITCADAASIPEVVGDAGMLFDPGSHEDLADKLASLWGSRRMQDELVDAGRERVKVFTAANMVKVHLDAFRAACATSDPEAKGFYRNEVWGPLMQAGEAHAAAHSLSDQLNTIQSSLAWRSTAPLRRLIDFVRK